MIKCKKNKCYYGHCCVECDAQKSRGHQCGCNKLEELCAMSDRRYLAVSIKHSSGTRFTLWGWDRTEDEQKRCFSGYLGTMDYDKCELYSLEDFREHYGHGVIKCDCPVEMTLDLVKKWGEYDTVLVDCEEYKAFVN